MGAVSIDSIARLIARVLRHATIALDTSVFIYHFEDNPRYRLLTASILTLVEGGRIHAVTSVITLMELTVQPWRLQMDGLARQYEALLVNFPHLTLADVDRCYGATCGAVAGYPCTGARRCPTSSDGSESWCYGTGQQ